LDPSVVDEAVDFGMVFQDLLDEWWDGFDIASVELVVVKSANLSRDGRGLRFRAADEDHGFALFDEGIGHRATKPGISACNDSTFERKYGDGRHVGGFL
jgi:hypothetical protein